MTQAPLVKITVTAQVGDNEPIEIATADARLVADANGNLSISLGVQVPDALNTEPACTNHKPVQHRDFKPPWCEACGEFGGGGGWLKDPEPGKPAYSWHELLRGKKRA